MRAEDFPRGWLEDWGSAFCGCIGEAESQHLANAAYAVGILKARMNDNFWQVLAKGAVRKIDLFKSQELSNAVYSVGILGLDSSDLADGFWKSLTAGTMRKIDSF
jgi:hypothetical protein